MRLIKGFILVVFVMGIASVYAQSERSLVRSGNKDYEDGNFSEAEVQYRKSLTKNPNYYKGKFNLGDAMYEMENYEESGKIYSELAEANLTPEQKSKVFYNQGNNFMKGQKYGEAVEAFKKSLRLNPNDFDAKYNLEYARKKLSEQQQQQQQDQDQNQDQDKEDQDKEQQDQKDQNQDEQDQKDQEQQDKEQDKQDQNQDQKNDKSDQKQDQQQQPQPQQISKQDAQRMLEALKNDEKQTLQELQKQKAKAVKGKSSEIDW